MKRIMTEELFAQLAQFPFTVSNGTYHKKYKWKLIEPDTKKVSTFYFECGYRSTSIQQQSIYTEHAYIEVDGIHGTQKVTDITAFLEAYTPSLVYTAKVHTDAQSLIQNVTSILGPRHATCVGEYVWMVHCDTYSTRLCIDTYKNTSEKTIVLETRKDNTRTTKLIDGHRLLTMLKHLSNKTYSPRKPQIHKRAIAVDVLTDHIQSLTIESAPQVSTQSSLTHKTKNNSIFISLPKKKRIMYQSCKPIDDDIVSLLR